MKLKECVFDPLQKWKQGKSKYNSFKGKLKFELSKEGKIIHLGFHSLHFKLRYYPGKTVRDRAINAFRGVEAGPNFHIEIHKNDLFNLFDRLKFYKIVYRSHGRSEYILNVKEACDDLEITSKYSFKNFNIRPLYSRF